MIIFNPTKLERVNNPLGLHHGYNQSWSGMTGFACDDWRLVRYMTPFDGIRAGACELVLDYSNNLKSLSSLCEKWKRKSGKIDQDYTNRMSKCLKTLEIDLPFNLQFYLSEYTLPYLWRLFCLVENGRCLYNPAMIEKACVSAFEEIR